MGKETETRRLVIIGAGPGGYAAAFRAADLGVEVTLIDREENPGGVCLYRGCIPAKVLLHAAKLIKQAAKAKEWGLDFGRPSIDLDRLRRSKNAVIARLAKGLGSLCRKRKIEYIQGTARFTGPDRLRIERAGGDAEETAFETAVIATGGRSVVLPNIPMDSEYVMDSDMSLEIKEIPDSMLVIGAGYIGLEQANIYARLGSRVSVVEMAPQMLPGSDEDLVSILTDYLGGCFENIMLNSKVSGAEEAGGGIKVSFEGDARVLNGTVYNKVLVAVGRRADTRQLGLEQTGIEPDRRGFIPVDRQRRTGNPRIFAAGDVTGDPQFAHKASHEGVVAAEVIAGRPAAFDPAAIPFVEYTEMELAGCGLTEQQARQEKGNVRIARFPWSASGRALSMGEDQGMTKLVVEEDTGRILGAGIVGSDAGKLISQAVLAVEMAAVAEDLARTIHPHPTLSETLMEAAEVFLGRSINL